MVTPIQRQPIDFSAPLEPQASAIYHQHHMEMREGWPRVKCGLDAFRTIKLGPECLRCHHSLSHYGIVRLWGVEFVLSRDLAEYATELEAPPRSVCVLPYGQMEGQPVPPSDDRR